MGDDRVAGVADAIDGSVEDWTVSGDAMRWSPSRAARSRETEVLGVHVPSGVGALLHVHPDRVRRVVSRAVTPFAEVAADMLDELRGLSRPRVRRGRAPRERPTS